MAGGAFIWAIFAGSLDLSDERDLLTYIVAEVLNGCVVMPHYHLRVRREVHSRNTFIWWRA